MQYEMIFKPSESFERPLEIDDMSSKYGVYIRQNIRQEEYENEEGEKKKVWRYEEAFVSKEDYMNHLITFYTMNRVELKREAEIVDEYTMSLIENGVIGG